MVGLSCQAQAQGAPQPVYNLQLKRSYSGQQAKDNIVMLTYSNVRLEGGKIRANVKLVNTTGTWIYAEQNFTPSVTAKTAVAGSARVYLLGPFGDKDLGTIEFAESAFLQFNAQSPVGLTGSTLSPQNRILLGALAIDLIMRGLFNKELPNNAFDRPVSGGIELGLATIDPLFNNIVSHCSGPLGAMSYSLMQNNVQGVVNNLGNFALCTRTVKEWMNQWLIKHYTKEQTKKYLERVSKELVDILDAPTRATLMGLLTKDTLSAPPQSWVRIEAIRPIKKDKPVIDVTTLSIVGMWEDPHGAIEFGPGGKIEWVKKPPIKSKEGILYDCMFMTFVDKWEKIGGNTYEIYAPGWPPWYKHKFSAHLSDNDTMVITDEKGQEYILKRIKGLRLKRIKEHGISELFSPSNQEKEDKRGVDEISRSPVEKFKPIPGGKIYRFPADQFVPIPGGKYKRVTGTLIVNEQTGERTFVPEREEYPK